MCQISSRCAKRLLRAAVSARERERGREKTRSRDHYRRASDYANRRDSELATCAPAAELMTPASFIFLKNEHHHHPRTMRRWGLTRARGRLAGGVHRILIDAIARASLRVVILDERSILDSSPKLATRANKWPPSAPIERNKQANHLRRRITSQVIIAWRPPLRLATYCMIHLGLDTRQFRAAPVAAEATGLLLLLISRSIIECTSTGAHNEHESSGSYRRSWKGKK